MQRVRRRTAWRSIAAALAATLALAAPAYAQADGQAAPSTATGKTKPDPYPTMYEVFGQDSLENGKFMWKEGATEVDRVVLVLSDQMIFAYDKDEMVGVSTVSTGRPGHETRPGSFKILAKHRYYYSKKYDNAPMPYMQQITSYGVALHAGQLPGRPASHGCIRLPTQFAANLFAVTQIGTPVVIEQ
ncbi:MAG TPA: L,D-transpeptidase family protein [Croceibacterium sp.]|jgi:hypothetical protein